MKQNSFYEFEARSLQGKTIPMVEYRNKVVLVVNTASQCGLTPQYKGLEELYKKYRDKGLVILGFPCNQFGNQEPGNEKEIAEGCLVNYGISFQMFSKIDVNGENTHALYKFLKEKKHGWLGKKIRWNFTKFLIDRNGKVIERFSSITTPEKIEKYIQEIVN